MHRQVEIRIVPLYGFEQATYGYLGVKFLPDLTHQRCLRALTRLDLSARKLPPSLPLAISALSGKDLSILDNDCCRYFYRFHYATNRKDKGNDIYESVKERPDTSGASQIMSETPIQYWNYVPETLCLYEYNRQTSGNLKTRKGDMNRLTCKVPCLSYPKIL